jgi:hypothetical protein
VFEVMINFVMAPRLSLVLCGLKKRFDARPTFFLGATIKKMLRSHSKRPLVVNAGGATAGAVVGAASATVGFLAGGAKGMVGVGLTGLALGGVAGLKYFGNHLGRLPVLLLPTNLLTAEEVARYLIADAPLPTGAFNWVQVREKGRLALENIRAQVQSLQTRRVPPLKKNTLVVVTYTVSHQIGFVSDPVVFMVRGRVTQVQDASTFTITTEANEAVSFTPQAATIDGTQHVFFEPIVIHPAAVLTEDAQKIISPLDLEHAVNILGKGDEIAAAVERGIKRLTTPDLALTSEELEVAGTFERTVTFLRKTLQPLDEWMRRGLLLHAKPALRDAVKALRNREVIDIICGEQYRLKNCYGAGCRKNPLCLEDDPEGEFIQPYKIGLSKAKETDCRDIILRHLPADLTADLTKDEWVDVAMHVNMMAVVHSEAELMKDAPAYYKAAWYYVPWSREDKGEHVVFTLDNTILQVYRIVLKNVRHKLEQKTKMWAVIYVVVFGTILSLAKVGLPSVDLSEPLSWFRAPTPPTRTPYEVAYGLGLGYLGDGEMLGATVDQLTWLQPLLPLDAPVPPEAPKRETLVVLVLVTLVLLATVRRMLRQTLPPPHKWAHTCTTPINGFFRLRDGRQVKMTTELKRLVDDIDKRGESNDLKQIEFERQLLGTNGWRAETMLRAIAAARA